MTTKPDDPAFLYGKHEFVRGLVGYYNGLTKLEYFAAMAMQGFCSNPELDETKSGYYKNVAKASVKQAKALIAELEKEGE